MPRKRHDHVPRKGDIFLRPKGASSSPRKGCHLFCARSAQNRARRTRGFYAWRDRIRRMRAAFSRTECARFVTRRVTPYPRQRRGERFTPAFFLSMRKKAPLTVERKNGKGGFASEQTPHPSPRRKRQVSSVSLFLLFPRESLRWIRAGAPSLESP